MKEMYFIIVIFFIVNLHIPVMQATCDKTLPGKLSSNEASMKYGNDDVNLISQNNHQLGNVQTNEQTVNINDLDSLRLEYNKYKILSHLGMTANPDQLAPELSDDRRLNLASITALREGLRKKDNSGVNLRHKRSLSCNQVKSDKDVCCMESFYVNFTEIGWDKWILYPAGYNANYCRGQCDLSHARYYHSTLLSKFSNIIGLCCSPKQMAPLSLLYIDDSNKVHQKSMPDMIVESCDCA